MALTARWHGDETRWLALRLLPGEDLRAELEAAFASAREEEAMSAGFVAACCGSLHSAALRPAGRDEPLQVPGPLEIVSLSGTLSLDGPHLHMAVSDEEGVMRGGHLLAGCEIRTTAEIVLGLTGAARFHRPLDVRTGWRELDFG
ncbi:PPC domain-containing DNA-binding protein [Pseudoroseicyclus tamaricis]|uniref:DNA-binding protein n=1 Tax=Pseudoroseicyclus tamaricis TaxID=2705421 RepID=A0A6B2JF57_9RHOB|nr:PPC domain-containing DNA-binding protein [Pseudoroseicyclus tamaricis]NDU99612.1 DNA-binding protein [Pseudoroseicyclus tamaricis]